MLIGIGTKNPAKVSAVKTALDSIRSAFPKGMNNPPVFQQTATETSVPDMPLTQQELMQGALERALFTYKTFSGLDYALGLEGGTYLHSKTQSAFLQSWVYVFNGKTGYFGSSAALPLPANIRNALYDEQRELSDVIDNLSGKEDVRSNEGTFGILTRNLITRSQAFETATIAAMAPFFSKMYKIEEYR